MTRVVIDRLDMVSSLYTTREQTLERCPNLALASAFFAPGTKGLPLVPGAKNAEANAKLELKT